jgi:hypothetical protein
MFEMNNDHHVHFHIIVYIQLITFIVLNIKCAVENQISYISQIR